MITADCVNRMLPIVADSWPQLRRCDVFRLLNSIHYESAESVDSAAGIVVERRPDLAAIVAECADDIKSELA